MCGTRPFRDRFVKPILPMGGFYTREDALDGVGATIIPIRMKAANRFYPFPLNAEWEAEGTTLSQSLLSLRS